MFLLPAVFILAQTNGSLPPADDPRVQAALTELSGIYGQTVSRPEQARAICNLEQFLTDCAEIGKRHNLFSEEEVKQVDTVLAELKGKVVEDLKSCQTQECLVGVANRLASTLSSKSPALARQLELTQAKIEEKRVIAQTAKEIGVDIGACRTMDPDTASVELLRACAKLAKDQRIQRYLPEEARQLVKTADTSLDLRDSLRKGEYQCGDNTLNGCGDFCLNPAQGGAIPPVCREIADKFFGKEGVKQLEDAYAQVRQSTEFYKKKAEAVTFTTQDGRILTNPAEIGRYMEGEMQKGNVEAIEKGMEFMVTRGFVSSQDREFAVRMAKKIREQGRELDFDECERNPRACDDFIPEDDREEFGAMEEVYGIISEEMRKLGVPSPDLCENNSQYGEACVKASKTALPKIEEIAKKFPEARFVVEDIRRHISFVDKGFEARKRAEEEFGKRGAEGFRIGDQVFRSFQEMEAFCRENGQLCLTETARGGLIDRDYAAERYERSYEVHFGPGPGEEGPGFEGGFPGQGPFPGFGPTGIGGGFPPGQIPGFTSPGPGFGAPSGLNKEEALRQFQQWLDNPIGAPPLPNVGYPGGPYPGGTPYPGTGPFPPTGVPYYPVQPSFCAIPALKACPDGQYHPESRDQRGCPVFGACISVAEILPATRAICPSLPTVTYCPAGMKKVLTYSSPECGQYYDCQPVDGGIGQPPPCPTGQYWNGSACVRAGVIAVPPPPIIPQCSDGRDNDGDGFIDYPADTGCFGREDNDEAYGGPPPLPRPSIIYPYRFAPTNYLANSEQDLRNYCSGQAPGSGPPGTALYYSAKAECERLGMPWGGGTGPGTGVCTQELINLLGSGCHSMDNAFFDSAMTKYVFPGAKTLNDCRTTYIRNCTVGTGTAPVPPPGDGVTPPPSGQKQQIWNSFGLQSSIRTDADPARIEQLKQSCANVKSSYNIWLPGAGDPASVDFGMPDPAKCAKAASCTSTQYFDGANCVTSTTTPPPPPGTSPQCSDGLDNDGDGLIDYPADTGCYGSTDNDETPGTTTTPPPGGSACPSFAHDMGGYCMLSSDTTRCAEYYNASAEGNYTATTCQQRSGTTSGTTCSSGQYWNGTACVTSTTTTTCPSGQYWYVPPGGGAGYCQTTSSTDCPSGQYWNGTACVTSTTPPPSTSACSTPSTCFDSSICASSGWYWYNSGCWSSPQSTTPPPPPPSSSVCGNAICDGGETATSCPADCGGASPPPPPPAPPPEPPPPPPPPTSTSCPSGYHLESDGTCAPDTATPPPTSSFFPRRCPLSHDWNGSYCVVRPQYTAHFFAQIRTSARQFAGTLGAFLGFDK